MTVIWFAPEHSTASSKGYIERLKFKVPNLLYRNFLGRNLEEFRDGDALLGTDVGMNGWKKKNAFMRPVLPTRCQMEHFIALLAKSALP